MFPVSDQFSDQAKIYCWLSLTLKLHQDFPDDEELEPVFKCFLEGPCQPLQGCSNLSSLFALEIVGFDVHHDVTQRNTKRKVVALVEHNCCKLEKPFQKSFLMVSLYQVVNCFPADSNHILISFLNAPESIVKSFLHLIQRQIACWYHSVHFFMRFQLVVQ